MNKECRCRVAVDRIPAATAASITKSGAGVLQLSGANTFTGGVTVNTGGLILGSDTNSLLLNDPVTTGPVGSQNADSKNLPEMFLNFGPTKTKMYSIFDIDTGISPPAVTLEVYRVGEGRIERRPFTWDEILGQTKIKPLPPAPTKTGAVKPPVKPKLRE